MPEPLHPSCRDQDLSHWGGPTTRLALLAGIAVGTVLGLVSGNARLVLVEGSVPTAVFGLLCLGSLWSRRPLIFRFALEFMGAGTPRGRDFDGLWRRYPGFRHAFRLFTVVWGVAYLAEAAARVIIVETTSSPEPYTGNRRPDLLAQRMARVWAASPARWSPSERSACTEAMRYVQDADFFAAKTAAKTAAKAED